MFTHAVLGSLTLVAVPTLLRPLVNPEYNALPRPIAEV